MFVANADQNVLRQGDILAELPFPLLVLDEYRVLGALHTEEPRFRIAEISHRNDPSWLMGQSLARVSFGMVVTQCCDLEPRNGRILTPTFAVARLITIPSAIAKDPAKLNSLRANKDPRNEADPGYLNLFHVEANERLEGREWVVDYNQIFCIPSTEFPAIMRRKVLQIDDDSRIRFKIKLASSFARLTEQELNLNHPWLRENEPPPTHPNAAAEP